MPCLRKLCLIGLASMMIIIVPGCGYKDIDKRFFVVSIGIDLNENKEKSEKKYNIILKLAVPSNLQQTSPTGPKFILIEQKGDSITEAVRLVKSHVDRELDFSHSKIIVFGDSLLREENLVQLLDWFTRRRDIQSIAWMAVGAPTAKEVLDIQPESEPLASNTLFLSFSDGTESSYIIPVPLFALYKRMYERGLDAVLPVIEAKKKKKLLHIDHGVLLNKTKIAGDMTPNETKLFNILNNEARKLELWMQSKKPKTASHQQKNDFSLSVIQSKAKVKLSVKNNKLIVHYSIKMKANLEEVHGNNKINLKKYEKAAEKKLNKEARQFLIRLQYLDVDPLGLGMAYRANHMKKESWTKWLKLYHEAKFKVDTSIKIESTGSIRD